MTRKRTLLLSKKRKKGTDRVVKEIAQGKRMVIEEKDDPVVQSPRRGGEKKETVWLSSAWVDKKGAFD